MSEQNDAPKGKTKEAKAPVNTNPYVEVTEHANGTVIENCTVALATVKDAE